MAAKKPARDTELVQLISPSGTRVTVARDKVDKMKKLGFKEPEAPKPEPQKPAPAPAPAPTPVKPEAKPGTTEK